MLKCTKCKQETHQTAEFFPPNKKKRNGLDSWCRICRGTYRSEIRRGIYRNMIDDESLKTVLATTICCIICGDGGSLVVDHDHRENTIRGILCNRCNKGLGLFRDDPDLLEYARIYLLASRNDPEAAEYVKKNSKLDLYAEVH
jgi:hypothetical protein